MEFCQVVTILNGVVDDSVLFHGHDKTKVSNKAEQYFIQRINTVFPEAAKKLNANDLSNCIDNGYFQQEEDNSNAICLHWPTPSDADKY